MRAASYGLRIFRGKIIFFRVCRTLRSATNAIFTSGGAMVKGRSELQMQLTVTTPSCEKSISAKPAGLAEMQIKIIIPLSMRRATRSAFLIVMPPDSSRLYRPNPPCRGLRSGSGYEENIMKKQRKSV